MTRRNDEEFEERRQRIIDAALHVFAGKGFERATNKEVAQAAGIASPGLIYHYFKDKADLFRQVVEQRVPLLQLLAHPEELMALPPEEALTRFGRAYLRISENREAVAFMKLVVGEAVRRPAVARLLDEIGPSRAFRFLVLYLERQMDAGVLRRVDPEGAARSFFGPLIVFLVTREVLQHPDATRADPEAVLATSLDIFLRGMRPDP